MTGKFIQALRVSRSRASAEKCMEISRNNSRATGNKILALLAAAASLFEVKKRLLSLLISSSNEKV